MAKRDSGRGITVASSGVKITDFMVQGDPGTLETDDSMQNIKLMTPRELYMLWEKQQWASQDIDFTQDKKDWAAMTDEERAIRVYGLTGFYMGEERVTATFAPYVLAAEDPDEESFTATQLVDEARHFQFFDRFFTEVVGYTDVDTKARLEHANSELEPSFHALFDDQLQTTVDALKDDPTDKALKVRAITLYHMIIEGTLALTGQRFITDGFVRKNILPGFVEGFENIARDEHRHVAYGTWYLQQVARSGDADLIKIIHDTLIEVLPITAEVLQPPPSVTAERLAEITGFSRDQQHEYAFKSLSRRLKAIGIGLPAMA